MGTGKGKGNNFYWRFIQLEELLLSLGLFPKVKIFTVFWEILKNKHIFCFNLQIHIYYSTFKIETQRYASFNQILQNKCQLTISK